jgi:hypothetical protein
MTSNHQIRTSNHQLLIDFVLDKCHEEPIPHRIAIYRGLAAICGDADEEKNLLDLAWKLEKADDLCRAFKFSFLQQQPAKTSK